MYYDGNHPALNTFLKEVDATIKIQALARGYLARKRKKPRLSIEIPKWNIEEDTLDDGTIVRHSGPGHMGSPVMEFNPHPLKGIVPDPTEWHQEIVTNTLPFKTWVRPGKHASDHINIWDNGTITMSLTGNCFIG